ncbi:MAG: M67 family metallopeptidase [Planctomycetota bacterium]|jgi:proteasome lid subunit RPN8/RPN11
MLKLEIPNYIFADMQEQARAEAPIEACGILAGSGERVEKLYKMTNVEQRRDHFMMAPAEQFAAVKDIRLASLDLLAVYHSHPETPARPSTEDIRFALTPGIIHVIVSLQSDNGPVIKGFQIDGGSINEVPVKIVEDKK